MIEALAAAIEFRSEESGEHVRRIHDITRTLLLATPLGEGLSRIEIEQIALASIMHDVGQDRRARRHPEQARPADRRGV